MSFFFFAVATVEQLQYTVHNHKQPFCTRTFSTLSQLCDSRARQVLESMLMSRMGEMHVHVFVLNRMLLLLYKMLIWIFTPEHPLSLSFAEGNALLRRDVRALDL